MSGAREDEHYMLAAKTIVSADFLLISVGAGMSADSGLAVYAQVANFPAYQNMGHDYRSLCMPGSVTHARISLKKRKFYRFYIFY